MRPVPPLQSFQRGDGFARDAHLFHFLKKVCRQAYFTSRKGHHLKALQIMNDQYVPQKNHQLYCRVKAHLCLQVVVSENNGEYLSLTEKYKYLREAVFFARQALLRYANWNEYVYFYAGLLYCRYIYQLVFQPYGRPFKIKRRWADEVTYSHPPEKNISGVQQGLCDIVIYECRYHIGSGRIGERIKEEQLEDFMVSTNKYWRRKPNEVERALLTPKKRRKELKVKQKKAPVRVPAAAELVRSCRHQQKSEILPRSPQRNGECTVSNFNGPIVPRKRFNPFLIEELNRLLLQPV